jgi:hypothetical protein
MIFYDTEVLTIQTLSQLWFDHDPALLLNDNLTGVRRLTRRKLHPSIGGRATVVMRSRAEFQAFKDFLAAIEGRWQPFWMPTWNEDIRPVDSGGTTLITARAYSYETYNDDGSAPTTRRRCISIFDGAAVNCRTITQVDRTDDVEAITFTGAMGSSVGVGTYPLISYLNYCRMLQDGFDIQVERADDDGFLARCSFGVTVLPPDVLTP